MLRRGGPTSPNIEPTWGIKQRGYTETLCVPVLLWTFECKQQFLQMFSRKQETRSLSRLSHPFTPSSHFQVCGEWRMELTASVCSKVLVCVVSVVVIDVETVAEVVVFTDVVVHVVTVPVVDVVVDCGRCQWGGWDWGCWNWGCCDCGVSHWSCCLRSDRGCDRSGGESRCGHRSGRDSGSSHWYGPKRAGGYTWLTIHDKRKRM